MQTRISHKFLMCLLMLLVPFVHAMADTIPTGPDFPPDPGVVYVPPVVVIMGDTIDLDDESQELPVEIDVFGDSTFVYNTEENSITLNAVVLEDTGVTAINYTGTDTLKIILKDTSSIYADTVINSKSNVYIGGIGHLEAVGTVPIYGTKESTITFDSVEMHVSSVPTTQALQRRIQARRSGIKFAKYLDETGGPALSGFGSADFNKVGVTPGDAEYGPINNSGGGEEEDDMNALYLPGEDGEQEIVTEFWLTPDGADALPMTREARNLDISTPMYNILGLPVEAGYQGVVIQNGRKFILR